MTENEIALANLLARTEAQRAALEVRCTRLTNALDAATDEAQRPRHANPEAVDAFVRAMIAARSGGSRVDAVRHYRTLTGCTIKEGAVAIEGFLALPADQRAA